MLFCVFILGILSFLVNNGVNGGNPGPYWVHTTGFQGAGSVGQDATANGYAGSSLVSPLSSGGYNSPLSRNSASYQGGSSIGGFGGFGNKGGGSSYVAGGQGSRPYRRK